MTKLRGGLAAWVVVASYVLAACGGEHGELPAETHAGADDGADVGAVRLLRSRHDPGVRPRGQEPIVAGHDHNCVLFRTGKVLCWGANTEGQLGYGHTTNIGDDEPANAGGFVELGGAAVRLAAGHVHTCAVLASGDLRCWGAGWTLGLGVGTIGDDEVPVSVPPVDVGGRAVDVAAGISHTCVLLRAGNVRCWGPPGVLGYGHTEPVGDNEAPASAGDVPLGGKAIQLAAGATHTCALLDTGAVRCWGAGEFGQLGYGNTQSIGDDETPASAGDVDLGGRAVQIDAGGLNTCALMADGSVRCWGIGNLGRLGHGSDENIGDDEVPSSAPPVSLNGRAVQVDVGQQVNTCAVLGDGTVQCWGYNTRGALGYGHTSPVGDDELPSDVGVVNVGDRVRQITGGGHHTCASLVSGALRCWGHGENGRLGYGNTDDIGDDELPSSVPAFRLR